MNTSNRQDHPTLASLAYWYNVQLLQGRDALHGAVWMSLAPSHLTVPCSILHVRLRNRDILDQIRPYWIRFSGVRALRVSNMRQEVNAKRKAVSGQHGA
jgi:hypothetical protein